MIAKVISAIPYGYNSRIIEVEGDANRGLPAFNIVGMASKTVCEAKERVRSALVNSGFLFPDKKVTINLAPADLAKNGSFLDLSIALSILILSKQLLQSDTTSRLFIGELSLDGQVRPVSGIINIIETARELGIKEIIIPSKNLPQASLINDVKITGIDTLMHLFLYLKNQYQPDVPTSNAPHTQETAPEVTLDQIHGQAVAKRALEIAIAGHHNLLISGPPGAGKTMLAKAAVNLLPGLTLDEQISATKLYSLIGFTEDSINRRPFRAPHHSASLSSIIGGGPQALPGEISLAHTGVLFLDEIPEFSRPALESLRQPLEDKKITISRANYKVQYPADFMLIATMNPCPCGYYGDKVHTCKCRPNQIADYQKKLSGPLLDRIDLFVEAEKIDNTNLLKTDPPNHKHNVVKNNITEAIAIQKQRYGHNFKFNSTLSPSEYSKYIHLENTAKQLLDQSSDRLNLSARSYLKTIKVARTIADLDHSELIRTKHVAEALSYRKR